MKQKNLVIFAHGAMRLNDAKYVDEFTNKINATIKETFKKMQTSSASQKKSSTGSQQKSSASKSKTHRHQPNSPN
jgi:hypothetical protein